MTVLILLDSGPSRETPGALLNLFMDRLRNRICLWMGLEIESVYGWVQIRVETRFVSCDPKRAHALHQACRASGQAPGYEPSGLGTL